jgi:anti-sigma regulatory factor (Ser/Thr protein kinase)
MMETDRYVLEIDPDPQLVPTARMFAATVARQLGCPEDAVLDLKIAVSEACTSALEGSALAQEPVRLAVVENGNDLVYEVTDASYGFHEIPDEPAEVFDRVADGVPDDQAMRLALIRALFPSAEVASVDAHSAIRFRVAR